MKDVVKFDTLLSPLEQDILQILWPDKKYKVKHIYAKLKDKRKVALSSVAVILDRLHSHGVVDRSAETGRGGVRYIYYPKTTKDAFERRVVEQAVDGLIANFGPTAVSYFNERFAGKR
ncbi:BlaI/MecI/CopY family transcriptional regulator [Candidatus Woesearchaeota archaeon]|nr:BlaI/MecI/CopY family transcriptional regulator [Candidatus Woesearchaeota archaeon]